MAEVKPSFFGASTIAIITGASKGIGRAVALEFAKRCDTRLHLILTGRSEKDLKETLSLIKCSSKYSPEKTTVKLVLGDLGRQEGFTRIVEELFGDIDSTEFQHAILINNAGSTGDVTKFVRDFAHSDSSTVQDFFFLNVTSTLLLSSRFLSTFRTSGSNDDAPMRRTIVQLSSLSAVQPVASWSLYCTGKAARDMLHKVIAVEESDVRVLSYAPGPVDTAMLHYITDSSADPTTVKMMTASREIAVTPERTVQVLCDQLEKDEFESGGHIDLFDFIDPHQ